MEQGRRTVAEKGNGKGQVSFAGSGAGILHRKLLVISPLGMISDALIGAIEREFPWLTVEHAVDFRLALNSCNGSVQLILVDHQLVDDFIEHREALAQRCPLARSVLMAGFYSDPASLRLTWIMETGAIRGILPMDVNLDVWLSILRIMLKGGEYYPPGLLNSQYRNGIERHEAATKADASTLGTSGRVTMENLTRREVQVLAKVAEGKQNKIIAADLALSEHTVKIHLHNIIHKLGVHNRTEAAAMYHARASRAKPGEEGASEGDR